MSGEENKELIVLGAGESGVSAARLAHRQGLAVFVSDAGAGNPRFLAELDEAGIAYETGGHDRERLLAASEVVKSPGIPDTAPLVVALREAGIPVISEIEFAYRFAPAWATIVGITGSNGKTTTTLLTHHLLVTGGANAVAGGNLGDSFARLLVDRPAADVYVLELSSFQLDGIRDFRPNIAALLNITPDHLDRYGYQFARYADAKFRIAMNQDGGNLFLIAPSENIAPARRRNKTNARVVEVDVNAQVSGGKIEINGHQYSLAQTNLVGRHNAANALFAAKIADELGVNNWDIQRGLDSFRPAAHRMERIATRDGRRWINDSKATNVDSAYYALEAMDGPTVWIAGGTDKGNDYGPLLEVVTKKVHTLVCLGLDNEKLKTTFADRVERVVECQSAAEAVHLAQRYAGPEHNVLLSPACASFDLFKNYEDRGDRFRAAVLKNTEA